jgi:hypothetical protein
MFRRITELSKLYTTRRVCKSGRRKMGVASGVGESVVRKVL